jgi:hypothetical protein
VDKDPQDQGEIQHPQEPDETQDETENEDSDKEDVHKMIRINGFLSKTSLKQNGSEERNMILYDGLVIIQIPGNQGKISPIT